MIWRLTRSDGAPLDFASAADLIEHIFDEIDGDDFDNLTPSGARPTAGRGETGAGM